VAEARASGEDETIRSTSPLRTFMKLIIGKLLGRPEPEFRETSPEI
jgi:hypothetical protein